MGFVMQSLWDPSKFPAEGKELHLQEWIPGKAWIIPQFLSQEECAALIRAADDQLDFDEIGAFPQYRRCFRSKFDDPVLLDWMWKRLLPLLPAFESNWYQSEECSEDSDSEEELEGTWRPYHLYRYPRLCKYTEAGHHFNSHYDYSVTVERGRRSFL